MNSTNFDPKQTPKTPNQTQGAVTKLRVVFQAAKHVGVGESGAILCISLAIHGARSNEGAVALIANIQSVPVSEPNAKYGNMTGWPVVPS